MRHGQSSHSEISRFKIGEEESSQGPVHLISVRTGTLNSSH